MPAGFTSKRPKRASPENKKVLLKGSGALIEFTEGEDRGHKVPLTFTRTVFGRKFGDILVRDLNVSSTHVAIEYRGGSFFAIDLGSSNGTFVRGNRIKEIEIEEGDEVRMGASAFVLRMDPVEAEKLAAARPREVSVAEGGLRDLLEREFGSAHKFDGETPVVMATKKLPLPTVKLKILIGADKGKEALFTKPQIFIGRKDVDMVVKDVDVSRKHALIECHEGGEVLLRDLASTNGTFVNNRKVANCVLAEGDRIQVGATTLLYSSRVER